MNYRNELKNIFSKLHDTENHFQRIKFEIKILREFIFQREQNEERISSESEQKHPVS